MKIIICIDERLGFSFNGRRQSRDRALTRDIVNSANGRRIIIEKHSALLFEEAGIALSENNIIIKDSYSEVADGDIVFLENFADESFLLLADELVLYSWNRHYPATKKLDRAFLEANFELCESFEFSGNSHEKLTRYTTKRK